MDNNPPKSEKLLMYQLLIKMICFRVKKTAKYNFKSNFFKGNYFGVFTREFFVPPQFAAAFINDNDPQKSEKLFMHGLFKIRMKCLTVQKYRKAIL